MAKRYDLILVFINGSLKGQRAKIKGDRVIIGTADTCDVRLTDEGISRQHAAIRYEDQKYLIEDLKSLNGVVVNKERIERPCFLYHKDRIRLGNVQIGVLIPGTKPKKLVYKAEKLDLPIELGAEAGPPSKLSIFKNRRAMIYLFGGVFLLLLLFLMMGEEPETEKTLDFEAMTETELLDVEELGMAQRQLQQEIEARQKKLSDLREAEAKEERERIEGKLGRDPQAQITPEDTKVKLAKEKFERGIRELRGQNFLQAEKEFNLALALDPNDQLTTEYLIRTRRKRRAMAMDNYELGKRYFSTLQYELAISHFKKSSRLLEIESKNLDNESKGYVEILENIQSYIERGKKHLGLLP